MQENDSFEYSIKGMLSRKGRGSRSGYASVLRFVETRPWIAFSSKKATA